MASSVASPLERQFTTIAGVDEMTSSSGAGNTQHHADLRPRPQHRQRGRRRADGDRRGDAAAAVHADGAAVVPQAESGRPADPAAQPDVEHARDVGGRRLRGEHPRAAHLDGERRVAGQRVRARRSTPCACRSIRTSCRRRRSGSTRSIRRCRTGTSTSRPGSCSDRSPPTRSTPTACSRAPTGCSGARRSSGRSSSTYRHGRPVRLEQVANVLDSVETTTQRAWLYTKAGRSSASSRCRCRSSRAPTSSR